MQETEASTQDSMAKRVSVRTGGAGHAHSGVIKEPDTKNGSTAGAAQDGGVAAIKSSNIIVRLGR